MKGLSGFWKKTILWSAVALAVLFLALLIVFSVKLGNAGARSVEPMKLSDAGGETFWGINTEGDVVAVSEGQKLGLARVYYGNELIDETDLLAIADVTRSEFSSVASSSTAYIQQNWWKWIVFLILGVIAAFLILLVLLQIRRRRLRRLRLEKRRRDLEKQYRRRYRDDREE